ncbi:MAG: heavy metal-associated domain-containing protein [Terrimicrobiaceae bacterium]|nr:heavy metal-associated domain-containing protein [Terrimicrobiaceae bacterium]
MSDSRSQLEELDLAIPDMHSTADEVRAGEVLRGLDGVNAVRFVARGALVSYRPASISHEQICEVLRHAGFRATTFQDSASGDVGLSSA